MVVYLDHHILCDLTLDADMKPKGMGGLKLPSMVVGSSCREERWISQHSERTPEKESRRLSDGAAACIHVLIRRKPRKSLYVADVNHGVGRDRSMSGRDHAVKPVNSD